MTRKHQVGQDALRRAFETRRPGVDFFDRKVAKPLAG
jgi:hypothetical protein